VIDVIVPDKMQVRHVVWTCRHWNFLELSNAFGSSWRERATDYIWEKSPKYRWVARWRGQPVALYGIIEFAPKRWSVYMVATEAVEQCARPLARKLRRTFLEFREREMPQMVIATPLRGNPKTDRWFRSLGATFVRTEGKVDIYSFDLEG
jgi:hypothetical protein